MQKDFCNNIGTKRTRQPTISCNDFALPGQTRISHGSERTVHRPLLARRALWNNASKPGFLCPSASSPETIEKCSDAQGFVADCPHVKCDQERIRAGLLRGVFILPGRDACAAAVEQFSAIYTGETVPPLPLAQCTCDHCECNYLPIGNGESDRLDLSEKSSPDSSG